MMENEPLTTQTIQKAIDRMKKIPDPFSTFNFGGFPLWIIEAPDMPKIRANKLSWMTDEDHAELQNWLNARFGFRPTVAPNTVYFFSGLSSADTKTVSAIKLIDVSC